MTTTEAGTVLTPEEMNHLYHVLDAILGRLNKGHGRKILTLGGTTLDGRRFSGFLWLDVKADL